jgi:hypothetical protein
MTDLQAREPLIFELSRPGRGAGTQFPPPVAGSAEIPAHWGGVGTTALLQAAGW